MFEIIHMCHDTVEQRLHRNLLDAYTSAVTDLLAVANNLKGCVKPINAMMGKHVQALQRYPDFTQFLKMVVTLSADCKHFRY